MNQNKTSFRLCCAVVEGSTADALLLLLPTADVLSEEAILKWYSDGPLTKGRSIFLEQMKKFVEWLKNAEEGKVPNVSDSLTRRGRKGLVFISTRNSLCPMSHLVYTERPGLNVCPRCSVFVYFVNVFGVTACFYYFRCACVQNIYLLQNVFSRDLGMDEQNVGDTDTLAWNKPPQNSL